MLVLSIKLGTAVTCLH